ncbi:PP2C family protein-serine/threonine phosphatase [Streptomyces sp. UNOC14_S4]|uniref:PP2C family protein-serine/threonine phosphatase n=1 Tax=Streptomyces sp. UNOC14_S4 TaxID=2872340 RepID=UPI001E55834F|nr:PP2C family protein-serine/threonine phosphatase [Streptomyces sp. UNOC14_S4]MCC3767507.1 serine/threonine-protein phosphatase [Streptomyces sp. UNOC14_S4]
MRFRHPSTRLRGRRPGAAMVALPVALMAIIAAVDITSPPDIHLGPLLVIAPAVTASFAGPGLTGAIGGLSVVTQLIIGAERDTFDSSNIQMQSVSLAVLSVFLMAFTYFRESRKRELASVRRVSEAAQNVLLRPLPRRAGPLEVDSRYQAAEAHAHVGGDLYALARTPDGTRLIIGDVQGKGLASLSDSALLMGAFRAAAHRHAPLAALVAYLEGGICWGLVEFSEDREDVGERFVTAAVLDIPDGREVLHLINCGHPSPLLLRQGGAGAVPLDVPRPAPPLGLGDLSDTGYEAATFDFRVGDLLLLYTDGVSEARDHDGVFYPLAERAAALAGLGPEVFLQSLSADLVAYVGGPLNDDVAMVAVRRNGGA